MLLIVIGLAAFASTLAGGLLALRLRDRLHLILGFSAGAVIGVAFFDLLPEAVSLGAGVDNAQGTLTWTALGFLSYLLLDRVLAFHADDAQRGSVGAAIFCIHSVLDGLAIGLAFQTSRAIGVIVAIGVLTHDFSDGINTMSIVLKSREPGRRAYLWLIIDALAPMAGIGATLLFTLTGRGFGIALGLFAGFFLYIGASDLIPESYHAHPKFQTTVMTLIGAGVLYAAVRLIG